jgi:hypothetical protein
MTDTRTLRSTSLVNFIWTNADDLWGAFKHADFGKVILPLTAAVSAIDVDWKTLAAVFKKDQLWTHMSSLQKSTRLREVLTEHGGAFLQAVATFANSDSNSRIAGMRTTIVPHGTLTWPIATYLPFLWSPNKQMFLKPPATRDFAERIGHRFVIEYDSKLTADVYLSAFDLADDTAKGIAPLDPVHRIDVQSFIWVMGGYCEENLS